MWRSWLLHPEASAPEDDWTVVEGGGEDLPHEKVTNRQRVRRQLDAWWKHCLAERRILTGPTGGDTALALGPHPQHIPADVVHHAFCSYSKTSCTQRMVTQFLKGRPGVLLARTMRDGNRRSVLSIKIED